MQDQMKQARTFIKAKRYDEARSILEGIDHPTAKNWLAKLDEIDDPFESDFELASSPQKVKPNASVDIDRTRARLKGYETRRTIFYGLAVLSFMWLCYGLVSTASAVEQADRDNIRATEAEEAGFQLGVAIGSSISLFIFACTGLPLFLIFSLLGWRNSSGMRTELRHLESMGIENPGTGGKTVTLG